MSTGRDDIWLDQVCGDCKGDIMVAIQPGWPLVVQHVDSEREADHPVTKLFGEVRGKLVLIR